MWKPNKRQRASMARACLKFQEAMTPETFSYLQGRGISQEVAESFQLGQVPDGVRGYEEYRGRLSIPYLDKMGVCGWKFRCLADHDCKQVECRRYLNPAGQELGLYNVLALDSPADTLHICEGEMDAITLSIALPDPVIGVPGADAWQEHWPSHLTGFDRICLWPDRDDGGRKMTRRWREKYRQIEVMLLPPGEDVNSVFLKQGREFFVSLLEDTGEE